MAKSYELVLEALKQLDATKLQEAQQAFQEHSNWLAQAVQEAVAKVAACRPAGLVPADKVCAAPC